MAPLHSMRAEREGWGEERKRERKVRRHGCKGGWWMDGGMGGGGAARQGVVIVIRSEPGRVGRTLDTCWRGDKQAKAITRRYPAAPGAILGALELRLEYFS